jgi:hypothetical protein
MPNMAAHFSSSFFTVGSSPKTSSPTSAFIMASCIPGVGLVTVSLLKSIVISWKNLIAEITKVKSMATGI